MNNDSEQFPAQKAPSVEVETFGQQKARRLLFAREYAANGRNGPAAYLAAGYSRKNPAEISASVGQLLRTPDVQQELKRFEYEAIEDVRRRAGVSLERVLVELASQAFFDPRKLFDESGAPLAINELDDITAAAIEGVDVQEHRGEDGKVVSRIRKYKLARKTPALDMLMKHLGGYEQDNQQKGQAGANALVELLQGMRRSTIPVAARVDQDAGL